MKRLLFFWFILISCASAQVTVGMKEADLLKAKGPPTAKAGGDARTVYRWNTQIVIVEKGQVTKVAMQPVPAPNFQTSWQDESQYVIEQVAADLAEMGYYLKYHEALPGGAFPALANEVLPAGSHPNSDPRQNPDFIYRVTLKLGSAGEVTVDLPLVTGVWLPENYRPLTEAIFSKLALAPPPLESSAPAPLLQTLCDQHDKVLATADKALSARLQQHFDSASAHEQAALLLEAFALREAAGLFYQIRVELCRATAHLAFADQLRQKPVSSDEGRIAAAALATLYGNELRALELLNFPSARAETQAWQRALRMRVTRDFRPLEDLSAGTLLERLEWFRARCVSVGSDETRSVWQPRPEWADLPDWTRTLAEENPGVTTGHYLLETALPAEALVWQTIYPVETGQPLSPQKMVEALNAEPARCVDRDGVRVLGWGLWAAALQRELCHVLTKDYDFLERRWGVHDQAQKFREATEKAFGQLTLYPFVRRLNASEEKDYRRAQQDAMNLLRRSPHLIPANAWNQLCYVVNYCNLWIPPPGHAFINEWHRQNPLPGTVYNIAPRMNHPSLVSQPDTKARLTELHRLAPHQWVLARNFLEEVFGTPSQPANYLDAFAAIIDYTPEVAEKYVQLPGVSREDRNHYLVKSALYLPHSYKVLADILIREGKEDEAARYYAKWISEETDRVAVANSSHWMVQYLERHGRTQAATDLAEDAAEAYSFLGLQTKALLLESRLDYTGALVVWQQIDERYNAKAALLGWALRAYDQRQMPKAAEIRDAMLAELAPEGLRNLTGSDLAEPPEVGVLVTSEPKLITTGSLRKNDVIVGMRGYRVVSYKRYALIREIEPEKSSVIKVWRNGTYLDLPPVEPSYRFGVDLADYHR